MLRSACILTPRTPEDGVRISVMSRHTENDGKTPDRRITPDLFDFHWVALAPPSQLVGSWYREEISWPDFAAAYQDYLTNNLNAIVYLEILEDTLRGGETATVLCIEPEPTHCHRRLLVEHFQLIYPHYPVVIT